MRGGGSFNGFVVRTLQRVARAQDPRPEQAEFNTSLCFVSRQSKPNTPLQSLSPPGPTDAPPVRQEQDSEEARPAQCLLQGPRCRLSWTLPTPSGEGGWMLLWGLLNHLGSRPSPH